MGIATIIFVSGNHFVLAENCPTGYYWNLTYQECYPNPDCPQGQYFNVIDLTCVDETTGFNIPILLPGDPGYDPLNLDPVPVTNANTDPPCDPSTIENLTCLLKKGSALLVGAVVPLIFALAMFAFIWGVVNYVLNPENSSEKEEGQKFMLWGIIALFVMISIWGILVILENNFNAPGVGQFIPQLLDH